MNWMEATATLFGIICVALMIKRIIWCWPAGIIQVVLYVYIFWEARLYSDMLLHIVYIFLNAYGWYHWLHGGKDHDKLPVTKLGNRLWIWVAIGLVGTALWGAGMGAWTDADLPYGDAFTTVISLVAQWLLIRKRLENWILWIVVDIAAIGIYWHKGLYFTTFLYAVFLVLATIGYSDWRKAHNKNTLVPNS